MFEILGSLNLNLISGDDDIGLRLIDIVQPFCLINSVYKFSKDLKSKTDGFTHEKNLMIT